MHGAATRIMKRIVATIPNGKLPTNQNIEG